MSKRPKLSGGQGRKKRKEEEEKREKDRDALLKFLNPTPGPSTTWIVSGEDIPQVKEHFLGFLVAEESTGDHLSTLMLKRIEELNIPFEDCRGQSYDNGANMKGKNKGVQARLLQLNSRAFLVPCGAHTLNLVVADAAKSSPDALGYFGHLAKLFKLLSASTHRWGVLLKHVKTTLKSWAETRWESRIKSIEAVRYQARQVREALLEVRETATDPVVRVEAQSLAEEIGSYRFCICTAIWYDILSKIQYIPSPATETLDFLMHRQRQRRCVKK
ncbi:zinc finger MYM-type protein 1-like [Astatotilapia calliptera]|uniref:zinc finger MYM-type protein 1-like n=1 Tax=Astatotilapia calliptera TaxID=8154 RepID=UPI000E4124D6|nr:zinc finger MYM-type protein 1-like [Astatotilapia calliptera]